MPSPKCHDFYQSFTFLRNAAVTTDRDLVLLGLSMVLVFTSLLGMLFGILRMVLEVNRNYYNTLAGIDPLLSVIEEVHENINKIDIIITDTNVSELYIPQGFRGRVGVGDKSYTFGED